MSSVIIAVLIVSSIAAALAALIVIAEKFICNYGICKILINKDKEYEIDGGKPLLSSLTENKVFIPSACGGRGTCGLCKVKVLDGAGPVLPTETPFLSAEELEGNIRLSCQCKVKNDFSIEIPEELFNVKEFDTVCEEKIDLTSDMKLFRFRLQEPGTISYTPGQFVQFQCPAYTKGVDPVSRAYSMASNPNDNTLIDLIIRQVPDGICTTYCFDYLKKGDTVRINGPYGDFCLSDTYAPAIFIAGGSGMAPFMCLLHHMVNTNDKRHVEYYFGANTEADLCLLDEMKEFEDKLEDFTFIPVVSKPSDSWQGETGLVTEAAKRRHEQAADYEGYLCGGPGMINASVQMLISLGIPEEKIYYDKFA